MRVLWGLVFLLSSCASLNTSKMTLFKVGHLFDSKTGTWLLRQTLLIQNGKIISLNPKTLPNDVQVIDYQEAYVIPGLIDVHSHLFLEDPTYARDFPQGLLDFVKNSTEISRTNLGLKRGQSLLSTGFTSVRDLGNHGNVNIQSIKSLQNNSMPRFFSSGPGYTPYQGQFPPGTSESVIQSEYSLISSVSITMKLNFDLIKVYADEDPNPNVMNAEVFKTMAQAAHSQNLKVAAHASLALGIQVAIDGDADTIEHGTEITKVQLQQMVKKGIIFVPTHADYLFMRKETLDLKQNYIAAHVEKTCQNMRLAQNLGVPIAFGSDNYFSLEKKGLEFGPATLAVLFAFHDCGLTSVEVLRAATFVAAKAMGLETQIGSIEPNYHADFIVLRGDPTHDLQELKNPLAIYFNGQKQL